MRHLRNLHRSWRRISLRFWFFVVDLYLAFKRQGQSQATPSNVVYLTRFDEVSLSKIVSITLLPPREQKPGFRVRLQNEGSLSDDWLSRLRLWVHPKKDPNTRVLYEVNSISEIEDDPVLEVKPANFYWLHVARRQKISEIGDIRALCFVSGNEEKYFCLDRDLEQAKEKSI